MAFKIEAPTTFKASVKIPLPGGGETEAFEVEFKHRTRDEFAAFIESIRGKDDVDYVLESVVGWSLTDKFNRENVARLLQNYHAASRVIGATYSRELMVLRLGN
jgi:tail assembly chaperone